MPGEGITLPVSTAVDGGEPPPAQLKYLRHFHQKLIVGHFIPFTFSSGGCALKVPGRNAKSVKSA